MMAHLQSICKDNRVKQDQKVGQDGNGRPERNN